jgi:hypothetical protein
MPASEIEQVLSNWIQQATSSPGQLAEGVDPSRWVAQQFLKWWRNEGVERPLADAEGASHRIRSELERLGGWSNAELGEAMHELIHLKDALADVRLAIGLASDDMDPPVIATGSSDP